MGVWMQTPTRCSTDSIRPDQVRRPRTLVSHYCCSGEPRRFFSDGRLKGWEPCRVYMLPPTNPFFFFSRFTLEQVRRFLGKRVESITSGKRWLWYGPTYSFSKHRDWTLHKYFAGPLPEWETKGTGSGNLWWDIPDLVGGFQSTRLNSAQSLWRKSARQRKAPMDWLGLSMVHSPDYPRWIRHLWLRLPHGLELSSDLGTLPAVF